MLRFADRLTQNSFSAFRFKLVKLFLASGDGEIRTLDPLLARQVLSQLSYTPTDAGRPVITGYPLSSFFLLSQPFLFLQKVLVSLNGLKWTFPLFTEGLGLLKWA